MPSSTGASPTAEQVQVAFAIVCESRGLADRNGSGQASCQESPLPRRCALAHLRNGRSTDSWIPKNGN
jgi:hypothetical protein